MKILLVSSFLPYPLYSGGHVRLFNIIKGLSANHKIVLVCEKRDYQTENDIKEVKKICEEVITFDRKKQWTIRNILKTGFSRNAFLITGHTNPAMKKKIKELLASERFDLIHVETFYAYQNIPDASIPVVLIEHNIEYLVYKRFADTAPIFIRPFLWYDVLKLKYLEQNYWERANKLVAVSDREKIIMQKDAIVVPNGVDLQVFKFQMSNFKFQSNGKTILFIGDFKWMENIDAIKWILKEIWPKLKAQNSKLKLWVVGRKISDDIKQMGDSDVIFDENAPSDTSLIYKNATILLAPIRVGGGTSFKILEAMASGVPVITTPLGNEGIKASNGEEILLAENSGDFYKNIIDLLQNKELYIKIAKNARRFIEEKYDWKKIIKKLEDVYESVV